MQQLAYRVTDVEQVAAILRERGVRTLYDAPRRGTSNSRVNFLHPKDAGGVLVELVQLRGDVASGHVELRVTNRGDRELVIASAAYESSRWSAPMVRDDEARIPPGARRNLRLPLPEPTCDAGPLEHRATLRLAEHRDLVVGAAHLERPRPL